MLSHEFLDAEISEVRTKYPELQLKSPSVLEGILHMRAEYEGSALNDNFTVQITASNPHSSRLPALREIGGRTEAIAKKYGITDYRNLHRNYDGTACVCIKQVEKQQFPPGSSLIVFVEELVVPYLYGLSHFEQHGKWPWPDYSHGALGLLEFYADNTQEQTREDIAEVIATIRRDPNWKLYHKQLRKPSSKRSCLCGSRKPFDECHSKAWRGIAPLRAELQRLGLNLAGLFNSQSG